MVDSPAQARSKLGVATRAENRGTPLEDHEWHELRANLAVANIDAAIRKFTDGSRYFDDADLGHLVGLLLMQTIDIDGETVTFCERMVRQAVRECRARLAGEE